MSSVGTSLLSRRQTDGKVVGPAVGARAGGREVGVFIWVGARIYDFAAMEFYKVLQDFIVTCSDPTRKLSVRSG